LGDQHFVYKLSSPLSYWAYSFMIFSLSTL